MCKKIIQVIIGYWVLALGVVLIIKSDVGAGAWDTVYIGLQQHFGLTLGTWSLIGTCILIVINALLLWEKPQISTFIGAILGSIAIDFWMLLVFNHFEPEHIVIKTMCFVLGITGLSLGVAIYIRANLFTGAIDGLMLATSKRLKLSIKNARILNEFIVMTLGYLLGGPVGLGTFLLIFGLGYGVHYAILGVAKLKEKGLPII